MEPFVTHRGRVAVLDWSDVNTDLIIPARYLKRIERTGYGPLLFADKRYEAGGAPPADSPETHGDEVPGFPLNKDQARGATFLVVGKNFGCGSSREHAVWAVQQAGFRALIAPGKGEGFADIFESNAFNNGLLPIELTEDDWKAVADACRTVEGSDMTVDLESQTLTVHSVQGPGISIRFAIPEDQRNRLLKGLDAVAETLQEDAMIRAHEAKAPPWVVPQMV
ncbi:MAG: 3-isopropylmalate dehydratase small subunit [Isosphaeraceae bacterium]